MSLLQLSRLNRADAYQLASVQVNLTGETGDMGVLANHEPFIEQLKPGLLEVMEESGGNKKFFRLFHSERFIAICSSNEIISFWRICCRSTRLYAFHQCGTFSRSGLLEDI
jgi:hypothetical protein